MKVYAVKIFDISEKKLDDICLLIDLEKKHIIEKFIKKKDRIRALIGEMLIRNIIIEKLGVKNKDIKFQKNKYGKPYIEKYRDFNFNISHSGDFVVCAVDDKPVGIDIEEVKYIEYEGVAKNFFTTSEVDYIFENDSNIRLNKFYEIWTLKESYIKCCGQGLTIPLKSFSVNIDKCNNIKIIADKELKGYIFKKFDIELSYKVAVCSLNSEISSGITMIDQNSLISNYLDLVMNK